MVSSDRCYGVKQSVHDTGRNTMLSTTLPRIVSVDGQKVAAAWFSAG